MHKTLILVLLTMAFIPDSGHSDTQDKDFQHGVHNNAIVEDNYNRYVPPVNWPEPVVDSMPNYFLLSEVLEQRWKESSEYVAWDLYGWYGGDYERLWLKTEGEVDTSGGQGEADLQALYGQLISNYFDFQAGLRVEERWDNDDSDTRYFLSVGVQGLAPYYFDLEPTVFLSDEGDVSARFTGTYDILITQTLILQPRLEFNAALQDSEKYGLGSGFNDGGAGIRLRYEITRKFAPYVGLTYERLFGETASIASSEDESTRDWVFLVGLRVWL